ncbi:hypothetical protein M5D96_008662 [Drosophila gunungcola]|uniref:Uncharacterized protein n=1 Tax=Drosophila gunungcola TaxID=103775 RepID=A0A9P9YKP2_9MUSC|nr:hypothetical protein M5D96_008662 [Drosophila gunungcola]
MYICQTIIDLIIINFCFANCTLLNRLINGKYLISGRFQLLHALVCSKRIPIPESSIKENQGSEFSSVATKVLTKK